MNVSSRTVVILNILSAAGLALILAEISLVLAQPMMWHNLLSPTARILID